MARNEIVVDAPAARVWQILSEPTLYAEWVGGTAKTRRGAGVWPERGSSLEYDVGAWRFRIGDRTTVVECEVGRRLLLRARVGRLATVWIDVGLVAREGRTAVYIEEWVGGGAARVLPRLLTNAIIKARNVWSLERLRDLAEQQSAPHGAETAPAPL